MKKRKKVSKKERKREREREREREKEGKKEKKSKRKKERKKFGNLDFHIEGSYQSFVLCKFRNKAPSCFPLECFLPLQFFDPL
jgi:hypothetical protein